MAGWWVNRRTLAPIPRCGPQYAPLATTSILGGPAVLAEAVRPVTLRPKLSLGLPFSSIRDRNGSNHGHRRATTCDNSLDGFTGDVKLLQSKAGQHIAAFNPVTPENVAHFKALLAGLIVSAFAGVASGSTFDGTSTGSARTGLGKPKPEQRQRVKGAFAITFRSTPVPSQRAWGKVTTASGHFPNSGSASLTGSLCFGGHRGTLGGVREGVLGFVPQPKLPCSAQATLLMGRSFRPPLPAR